MKALKLTISGFVTGLIIVWNDWHSWWYSILAVFVIAGLFVLNIITNKDKEVGS